MSVLDPIRLTALLAVLALAGPVLAQDEPAAPDTEQQTPSPEEQQPSATVPVFQTSPDQASPIAGNRFGAIPFGLDLPFGRLLQVSAGVQLGYDDNVNRQPTASASWYTSGNLALVYVSNNERTHLDISASSGLNYYWEPPPGQAIEPNIFLRATLSHKLTERLTLDLSTFDSYQAQPDFSTEFTFNRQSGSFFRTLDTISLNYRWTARVSTRTNYGIAFLEHQDSGDTRIDQNFGQSVRFLLLPTTAVSGHYRISFNSFGNSGQGSTGTSTGGQGSTSQFLSASVDQTFSKGLKAVVDAGVQYRSPESGNDQISPYFDVGATYQVAERASVGWNTRYSIEEAKGTASGRTTFRTHLQARYVITGRTSAAVIVSYLHRDNPTGGGATASSGGENSFDIGPTLNYAVTPRLAVQIGYRYTNVDRGNASGTEAAARSRSYSRNRYFTGITLTF